MKDRQTQQPEPISQIEPPQPPFRRWLPTIVGITIVVLALGGIFAWQFFQTQEDEGIDLPQTTDETAGWQTFRSDEFGFEFKYPSALNLKMQTLYINSVLDQTSLGVILVSDDEKIVFAPQGGTTSPSLGEGGIEGEIITGKEVEGELIIIDGKKFRKLTFIDFDNNITAIQFRLEEPYKNWTSANYLSFNTGQEKSILTQDTVFEINQIISTFKFTDQAETANWQTYRNEEFGFEVKYPNNWEILQSSTTQFFISEKSPSEITSAFAITVSSGTLEQEISVLEMSLNNQYGERILNKENVIVAEEPGVKVVYSTALGVDSTKYFVVSNNPTRPQTYSLKLAPGNSIHSQILSTFKFTD